MTKPITSVAAMMLWEEGAFELKTRSPLHPEFADTKVWRAGSATSPMPRAGRSSRCRCGTS